jgi:hypothetical protein
MTRNEQQGRWRIRKALTCSAFLLGCLSLAAQAPTSRFVGTLTAVNGDTLTVKTDSGDVRMVQVPSTAVLKRVEPGQKDLSTAATIALSDLATGDRVLVRLDASETTEPPQASQIITIKQADVALKQQQEREAWQKSGIGGLVKSVDASAGAIVVTSGAGATAKTITIRVNKAALLKRYAPASVRFDLAQPAPIDAIQPGDQLRARGTKSADGASLEAAEVVSGSFRNISGLIASLDPQGSTFVVKDLLTKKQITVHITPDAQMHRLPEAMAQTLAVHLKGTTPSGSPAGVPPANAHTPPPGAPAGTPPLGGPNHSPNGATNGSDTQQMLSRAPVVQFADLKKGEAVMVVATAGATDVTAITLLAGVEPLLQAPEASSNLLSNWSMGTGGEAAAQ